MDNLTQQLHQIAEAIAETGFDGVGEIAVVSGAVGRTRPVLAELLCSPTEPVVARQRAFGAAARVVAGFPEPQRRVLSAELTATRTTPIAAPEYNDQAA